MNQTILNRINQIKSGQAPEGYKKTLVGIVPKEWVGTTLSAIFTFKNGLNKEKEAFGTGTPIVNYVDVYKKRGLKASDLLGRVTLSKREISNYNVRKGDVFFTRTSETIDEIGLSSVILDDVNDTVFSGFILRARPYNDRIITEYNQYCYSSSLMRHEIKKKSSCTTRALTNGNLLGQVNINLPSKTEQVKIAEILMKWDEAIEAQEQLIQKLEIRKKALMQKLLTPKDGWMEKEMHKIGELYQPQTISDADLNVSGYKVYGANGVIGYYNKFNHEESEIAITCRGSTCGEVIFTEPKSWITGNAMVFKVDISKYNKLFLYYLCLNKRYNNVISGSGQPQITRIAIKKLKFQLPLTKEEQKRIANILSLADKEIELHKQQLEQLTKQRKSMMQLLLTGIVRTVTMDK